MTELLELHQQMAQLGELVGRYSAFIREVANGMWFTLTLTMVIFFLALAYHRLQRIRRGFYDDTPFLVALALSVFVGGSCLRAGYIWLVLHCESFNEQCEIVDGFAWVLAIAVTLAIVGGICVIRVLSPTRWRPWSWLLAGLLSLAIPAAYYLA